MAYEGNIYIYIYISDTCFSITHFHDKKTNDKDGEQELRIMTSRDKTIDGILI